MVTMTETEKFELYAAQIFFASAWADQEEESGNAHGGEIMDRMPDEVDPAAVHAAQTLRMDMESKKGRTVWQMKCDIERMGNGDRKPTMEYFAHYSAMQAMGHEVGLHDPFGRDVYEFVKVPYIEFGSYSLEKDYFKKGGAL